MRQGEGRTAPAFLGQYVRMLRSDRASAGNDGLGRAESRPSRIGPINLDVKQMGERNAGNPHVASPCCRFHPAELTSRIGQCSAGHSAFAPAWEARPSEIRTFEATMRSLLLRPGDS